MQPAPLSCGPFKLNLLPVPLFADTLKEINAESSGHLAPMALASSPSPTISTHESAPVAKGALAMVIALFFFWGFITSLNDILIPHLKSLFTLNYFQAMLVQFFFFGAYFVFALPSGKVVQWIGYQRTMVAGLLVMGAGALCFIPAANAPSFALFLVALAIIATGMTFLQVAANPYMLALGPPKTASSRLNFAQAFNSLGTAVAPRIGGLLILGTVAALAPAEIHRLTPAARHAYQLAQANVVKMPYTVIAAILIAFAIALALYRLPKIHIEAKKGEEAPPFSEIFKHRHLLLAVVAIFVYVGAEVSVGSFLVNYISRPEIGNMTEKAAALYVSFFWGGLMVGRIFGAGITRKLRAGPVLGVAAIIALCLVVTSMLTFGQVAVWSIVVVGLFDSIMWPNIFALGLAGLGRLTNLGSSLLVSAILGGALIPLLQGYIADQIGIHHAFFLPVLCYLYICYFGFSGSKVRSPMPVEEPLPPGGV
jgi:FHS family L-fucose permease-like MFS transporter